MGLNKIKSNKVSGMLSGIKSFYGIGNGANSLVNNRQINLRHGLTYGAALGITSSVMGVSAMNRYNSGGTITRNNKGEKDIVGIPFL